jgi:8-amino-7-oxononanoate synthase
MFDLQPELTRRHLAGLYRKRSIVSSAQAVRLTVNGHSLLSFSSNDYLGLANHPDIKQAFITATEHYGVGSGSAHLITGHSQLHHECELRLAEFTGRDRALLFSNGYMANLAIASALVGRHDIIHQDKLNHASLIDAAKISGAKLKRYRHHDMAQLKSQLETSQLDGNTSVRQLIMTDGVFSMDGDCADLNQISQIASQSNSCCMVDDAHGFGVMGSTGAGLLEQCGLGQQQVPILMATLGKAIGTSGAFVAGSEAVIETLIQQARPYIYTTASPPPIAAATICSLEIVKRDTWRREKLQELIAYFQLRMATTEFELMHSATAIQPIVIGGNNHAISLSEKLLKFGIQVSAIRPPTVPAGSARLRITLSTSHEKADIDQLIKALTSN